MNAKHCDINFFIATLTRNNFKATEIYRLFVESWAADIVINVRRVQQIAKQYTECEKENFMRKVGSGLKRTSTCENNIAIVWDLIENDNRLPCVPIKRITGIDESSIRRILTNNLGKSLSAANGYHIV